MLKYSYKDLAHTLWKCLVQTRLKAECMKGVPTLWSDSRLNKGVQGAIIVLGFEGLEWRIRSSSQIHEFSTLWEHLRGLQLSAELPDSIVWKFTKHDKYTAASAYEAQFTGVPSSPMEHLIWRVWAPPKCKFFSWLAFQNRLWTANRLMKRRRPNQKVCMLYHSNDETGLHMFTQCRYSLSVWQDIFNWVSPHVPPRTDWSAFTSLEEWWSLIGSMPRAPLKGWRSLIILVCRELWKERNVRIFRRTFIQRATGPRNQGGSKMLDLGGSKAFEVNYQFWGVIDNFFSFSLGLGLVSSSLLINTKSAILPSLC
jgi:hypothetical protein